MPTLTWTLRADRRTADLPALRAEVLELADTLHGLQVHLLSDDAIAAAADAGTFRDFAPFATATAEHVAVLEALAEELVESFGFQIDLLKPPAATDDPRGS